MTPLLTKVDYGQGVEDAWSEIASFVPRLAAFLLILLVGYFIIKVLAKAVDKALERVGFDRAVERGGVARAMSKSQYDASTLFRRFSFTRCSCSCCALHLECLAKTTPFRSCLTASSPTCPS